MRILVIGGTRLVGRHIAQNAIDRGHEVTLFNRGRSDPSALPDATHLTGDRNKDLSALATGEWDATVDVSAYVPRQVRDLLAALDKRAGHYTFISTISVYGNDVVDSGFTEGARLLEPAWDDKQDLEKYGELKVGCEQVAESDAPHGVLVLRPGFVIGPYDYSERFTHWVRAVATGKPFTGPDPDQPLQCVDGRDLAAFTVSMIERQRADTFNVTAPPTPPTFRQVLDTIAAALDIPLPDVTWSAADDALPLSVPPDWWPKMRADISKAVEAGFTYRPLAQTVRDLADYAQISR
jgi:2'-hydroxyisoflavone reductase